MAGHDSLFLFAEEHRRGQAGQIKVWSIQPGASLEELGELKIGNWHTSYPFVFQNDDDVFIIPETSAEGWGKGNGEVALYRFVDFPLKVEKVATLLDGPYADSSIFHRDGLFYLFTFREDEGLLFISDQLEGPYYPHPANPISTDPRHARSGGAIIPETAERPFLLRPAQDCSITYGGDLTLMKIRTLSADIYEEEIWSERTVADRYPWASSGAHHISQCHWQGKVVTAIDGLQPDYRVSRLFGLFWRLISPPPPHVR